MESEQFSLCWDNFHRNMSSGMHSMLETEDLVDVTLAIEGQYLKAHKMVLSVCSPYFRKLFSMNPCKHPIFFMKDVSFVVMNDLLTFMYQGEVQVNQENLGNFIKTAEALQIRGLTNDSNEVEENESKAPKRPAVDEFRTPNKSVKKVPTMNVKRPKLSAPINNNSTVTVTSGTTMNTSHQRNSLPQEIDTQSVKPPEVVQFKMEPYDNMEQNETYDTDIQDSYVEDDSQLEEDYSVMENEEPKAGTSGDSIADTQDYTGRMKNKLEMPRYIVDGFVFHVNAIKGTPSMIYLRCLEYKRLGCHARATMPSAGTINDIKLKKAHNHPPDCNAEEKIIFMRELSEFMKNNCTSNTREVYNSLAPVYPKAAHELPYEKLRFKMHRWRRNGGNSNDFAIVVKD